MSTQLPLNISLRDSSSFENYVPGKNRNTVKQLVQFVEQSLTATELEWMVYLWGKVGSGKTHLLEAICRNAEQLGRNTLLVSLKDVTEISPEIFSDLQNVSIVCIDDIQHIAGLRNWETALFNLCEHRRQGKELLVMSGDNNPKYLGLELPDLATRLVGWGPVFQMHPLEDDEKLAVIKQRANNRGIEVSDDVIRYVLNRYPRDMQALFRLLEQVDYESLVKQRRVTIPFLRSLELDRSFGGEAEIKD